MIKKDINNELWREYVWDYQDGYDEDGNPIFWEHSYRIDSPIAIFYYDGNSTHRVLDDNGIVHCVPAPGQLGCVIRSEPLDVCNPVQF